MKLGISLLVVALLAVTTAYATVPAEFPPPGSEEATMLLVMSGQP